MLTLIGDRFLVFRGTYILTFQIQVQTREEEV